MSRPPKHEPTTKFLAVKNWELYQMKDRKKRDIRLYVKDYCGKDIDDPEYNSLTMSQRYLWDACCRVRGRSGRNLRNDAAWVSRACGVLAAERSVVGHNLAVIVSLGFLIPTNEEVSPSDSDTEDSCSMKHQRIPYTVQHVYLVSQIQTQTQNLRPRSGRGEKSQK